MIHVSLCKHQSQTLVTRHCLHVCVSSRCQPFPSQANNVQSCGQLIEKARVTCKENWEQLRTNSTGISQVSNLNHSPFLTKGTGSYSEYLQPSFQGSLAYGWTDSQHSRVSSYKLQRMLRIGAPVWNHLPLKENLRIDCGCKHLRDLPRGFV